VILDAMAASNCVLVNDHPPNAETAGDAGLYFSGQAGVEDLARQLGRLLDAPELVSSFRARALRRAEEYSWDAITDQYEQTLTDVCEANRHGPLSRSMVDLDHVPVPAPEAVGVR
jgi:glycosyltransferase involved in cell wall biosynthesis